MAGNYKNFMKLLESWPLDKSKTGRDFGQHLRDQIKVAFSKGDIQTEVDKAKCDRNYASLKRLASNQYFILYPRIFSSTGSGLTAEQCNLALSPELQEYFQQEDQGIIKRSLRRFKRNEIPEVKES